MKQEQEEMPILYETPNKQVKYCTWKRVVGFFPVLFILTIYFAAFWIYIFLFFATLYITRPISSIVCVTLFLLLLFITLAHYFRCIFAFPKPIETPSRQFDREESCNKCGSFKPRRTHHCSM